MTLQLPTRTEPAPAHLDRLALHALQSVDAAVSIVDLQASDQPVVFVNDAFCRLTGYSASQVLGRNCRFLQHPDVDPAVVGLLRESIDKRVAVRTVLRNQHRDGSDFWNALQLVPISGDGDTVTHYVGFQQDLSEWALSAHSVLSVDEQGPGAAWSRFELAVADALRAQASTPRHHAMLVLRHSGATGERPAQLSLAQRVSSCDRLRPLLAAGASLHFPAAGGLALLVPLSDDQSAGTLASHVLGLLQPEWPCLAGVAELPTDGGDARTLLTVATAASLRAATGVGDGLCFADATRDASDQRARLLFHDLGGALAAQQFRLVFQPIVDLATGELSGFEALLRWRHPVLGEVMPGEFIAQLEHRLEICMVTRWILQVALAHLVRWDKLLDRPLRVSVNVPAEVLLDDDFVAFTLSELERHHLSPRQLEIELTERSLASADGPVVARLRELRGHGVLVAIDDFGTGWSSLAYLARLPVDTLKVDMQFTRGVVHSQADAAIARMTVELARGLGLRCVAEGIESPGQRRFFTDLRCQEGQGYLFARPLEVEAVDTLLAAPLCFSADEPAQPCANPTARAVLQRMGDSLGWTITVADSGEAALTLLRDEAARGIACDAVFVDWQMPGLDGWATSQRIRALGLGGKAPVIVMVTAHGREMLARRSAADQALLDGFLVKPVTPSMLFDAITDAGLGLGPAGPVRAAGLPGVQRLAGLRLLVAEDNPNNQQVARELLEDEGASVHIASNGKEAVEAVAAADPPFDVVLMDLQMPVMDGFAATRAIREDLALRALPIVAMTANAMASDREACLAAGMNEHVGKPFDLNHLVQVLLRQTGRSAAPHSSATTAGSALSLPAAVRAAAAAAGVQIDSAVARLGGKAAIYRDMLQRFVDDLARWPAELRGLENAPDNAAAVLVLHTVKGVAATLGADALAAAAAQGEKALLAGGTPGAARPTLALAAAAIDAAGPALQALLDALQPPAPAPTDMPNAGIDHPQLREGLLQLAELLRNSDMGAMEALDGLQAQFATALGARMQGLVAAVAALEFDPALRHCLQLLQELEP